MLKCKNILNEIKNYLFVGYAIHTFRARSKFLRARYAYLYERASNFLRPELSTKCFCFLYFRIFLCNQLPASETAIIYKFN